MEHRHRDARPRVRARTRRRPRAGGWRIAVGRRAAVHVRARSRARMTDDQPVPRRVFSGAADVPAATLVRPDGMLAWKTDERDDEGARQPSVMSAILDAKPIAWTPRVSQLARRSSRAGRYESFVPAM